MLNAVESELRATTSVVAFAVERDVVAVSGDDADTYLHGQLSQDVMGMAVGSSQWSLLLQPQGKLDTWLRVTRGTEDGWLLDTEPGAGPAMLARLERFKLRTKVTFQTLDWSMVALRGPASTDVAVPDGLVLADPMWPGQVGSDLLGADAAVPAGVEPGDPAALEVLRLRAGVPAMGRELDERTIAAEAGIVDRSVSFTKGCYVGQELVARIDSRGNNTPRRLYGLRFADSAQEAPVAGSAVVLDGSEVGIVTSSARSAELGVIALAYLKRGTPVPVRLGVRTGDRLLDAQAVELPIG